jgi:cob(I)alamin adenosyltransferase
MSLFTGKGDDGTTYKFDCDQRFSKSADIAEALGTVDEINTFLGLVKLKAVEYASEENFAELISEIQQNLFIVQAELAGADQTIDPQKVETMSERINKIEEQLPPIKTFLVSGGSELSSYFDYARTISRRAERRVVKVLEGGDIKIGAGTLAYLNRLSSMLYALARLSNHKFGINEERPSYE